MIKIIAPDDFYPPLFLRTVPAIKFILLLFVALFIASCLTDRAVEIKTLERDILLTWIALEREDAPRVAAYGAAVQQDWILLQHHSGIAPVEPALRESVVRVNLWMLNLRNAVDYDQPERAMMAIHLMQNEIRVLRPQLGMLQSADLLYDFYYQWQDVMDASNDPMMCLLDCTEYEAQYELAAESWTAYLADRPNISNVLFPGYGQNASEVAAAELKITRSLEYFATIIEGPDLTLTAGPSRAIEDLFFDYLAIVIAYPGSRSAAEAVTL